MTDTQLIPSQVITDVYNHIDKALEVKDYPYGFRLRTSIFYWIETKKGKGDRLGTRTINPKNGRFNAPKYSTYSPFLYLQTNEEGHVKTGGLDAYHVDQFEMRFGFILKNFYPLSLSADQQYNIRMDYYGHIAAGMPYAAVKYNENKQDFLNWCKAKLQHIKSCPFDQLVEYPEAPEPDQPNEEVKFVAVPYVAKEEPADPVHTITAEKVTAIIEKAVPGFYVKVEQYNGFAGTYLKIAIAVNADKAQQVSLSLNLKTLELQSQQYGGNGGQWIYREPNKENKGEQWLAMKSVKIPFRRPACNEKDVLSAIQRFAVNYKSTLIENVNVLIGRDKINYSELLQIPATI